MGSEVGELVEDIMDGGLVEGEVAAVEFIVVWGKLLSACCIVS